MVYTILEVVGASLIAIGFLGIMALIWAPFFSAIRAVFFRDRDDLMYQTAAGKNYLRKENIFLIKICIFFIVLGFLLFGYGYYVKHGPRGNGSIFSKNTEGVGENASRNDMASLSENVVPHDEFGGVSVNEAGITTYYITISGQEIIFDSKVYESATEFEKHLLNYKRTAGTFVLVDDFAIKKTYDDVEKIVKENGYDFKYDYSE